MSPLYELMIDANNNRIFIKRDDLIPFSFGGNKVRIAQEFIKDMRAQGKNCIIGYGNARSNLSRALSNLCYSQGIKCHIISPADDDGSRIETFNSLLVKKSMVEFHECSKNNVADTVKKVMSQCETEGYSPYYIYGTEFGKGNETTPLFAYKKAYEEIQDQLSQMGVTVDYIFLATGTGMTQGGLLIGKSICQGNETIIGVSVARSAAQETKILKTYLDCYKSRYGLAYSDDDIIVEDSFLCGGYGKYDESISATIDRMYINYGIPFDPTYTGKAFYGMQEYISNNNIKEKNVLFIHTGGAPLFFDSLKNKNYTKAECTECSSEEVLISFMNRIDKSLPVPLSKRVDLNKYVCKILNYGKVIAINDNQQVVSAIFFYANNFETRRAYITLIATLSKHQGLGYAGMLLDAAENYSKAHGMRYMTLETDFSNNNAISFYAKKGYCVEFANTKLHMIKELI